MCRARRHTWSCLFSSMMTCALTCETPVASRDVPNVLSMAGFYVGTTASSQSNLNHNPLSTTEVALLTLPAYHIFSVLSQHFFFQFTPYSRLVKLVFTLSGLDLSIGLQVFISHIRFPNQLVCHFVCNLS